MQLPSQLLQRGNVVNTLIFPNVQVNLNVSFLLMVSHHKLSRISSLAYTRFPHCPLSGHRSEVTGLKVKNWCWGWDEEYSGSSHHHIHIVNIHHEPVIFVAVQCTSTHGPHCTSKAEGSQWEPITCLLLYYSCWQTDSHCSIVALERWHLEQK